MGCCSRCIGERVDAFPQRVKPPKTQDCKNRRCPQRRKNPPCAGHWGTTQGPERQTKRSGDVPGPVGTHWAPVGCCNRRLGERVGAARRRSDLLKFRNAHADHQGGRLRNHESVVPSPLHQPTSRVCLRTGAESVGSRGVPESGRACGRGWDAPGWRNRDRGRRRGAPLASD